MASIRANAEDEDSEEDADFDMKSEEDDEGEPSDDSEAESGDAEMMEEQPKVSCFLSLVCRQIHGKVTVKYHTAGCCREKAHV